MRLRLHNIGPVRDADITLGGLSVLVGPNGSGKTTVSAVAYAVALSSELAFRAARRGPFLTERHRPADAATLATRTIEAWEMQFRRSLETELKRCVTRDIGKIAREGRAGKGAAPRIYVSNEPAKNPWCVVFRLDGDGLVVERSNPKYRPPVFEILDENLSPRQFDAAIMSAFRTGIPHRSYYFPAARSGFMQTFSALTALVFGALGGGYFEAATVGAIPGTAADFLRFLAQMRVDAESRLDPSAIDVFEREVLRGQVKLVSLETASDVLFSPEGLSQSWPIGSAATSAAELAPLILYLRHIGRARDALFIDEPEAHFHPANQVALAKGLLQMADLVQSVVIATHSEFLVSGLSNLLLARELAAQDGDGPPLPRAQVSVYEFNATSEARDGVTVAPLRFDPSEGFDIEQFSHVADATYAESVKLYDAVHQRPE